MESIRISCVGDLLPADTAYTLGTGIGSSMDRLISFYSVKENNPFLNSDLVFCNLEAPLVLSSNIIKKPFEGNPDVLQLMKLLNISVVSIANNHVCDHGLEGFSQTSGLLKDNWFLQIGSNQDGVSEIGWMACKNKKLAFAAFNGINDHPECILIAPLERAILFNTLNEIKKQSPDFIIYSLHWGNEYVTWPSPAQAELAHELIDNGVNIIIGHHPHVVQPVENYHGGIIIYSLGNFLFDMFWSKKVRNGIQVDLDLHEDKSIDYRIKQFLIQPDFTRDYINSTGILSGTAKTDKKFNLLKTGRREVYEKAYLRECKKRRLNARLQMKIYLLRNVLSLSRQSRGFLFSNIKMKSGFLWKKN